MQIRKLTTWQECVEAERIRATAFLHKFDREESEKRQRERFESGNTADETFWGTFDDDGRLGSAIMTGTGDLTFDRHIVKYGEAVTVTSDPEFRGRGAVRKMFGYLLDDFRESGCVFATLHPFSYDFYRKFGFELSCSTVEQSFSIDQLAGFKCELSVRRVASQQDTDKLKVLWHDFALGRNLLRVRSSAKAWEYRGEGEFGEPTHWDDGRPKYTYIFEDRDGKPRGYFTFIFREIERTIIGSMEIRSFVYDGPDTFRSMLGFIYGLRAKCRTVVVTLQDSIDFADILPEAQDVKRTMGCGDMLRVVDVKKALELMRHPAERGEYTVAVGDKFCAANTGTYRVRFGAGSVEAERTDAPADLRVTVETLGQLLTGYADLNAATFRAGTEVCANADTLRRVFVKKTVCAG